MRPCPNRNERSLPASPRALACGENGRLFLAFEEQAGVLDTAEKGLARLKAFGPDSKWLGYGASPAFFEDAAYMTVAKGGKSAIADLGVDGRGRVVVLDAAKSNLLIFSH